MKRFKSIIALLCCFLLLSGFNTVLNKNNVSGKDDGILREVSFDQMVTEIA